MHIGGDSLHVDKPSKDSIHVATLALGSRPRQWLLEVRTKSEARESHFMLLGMQESVKE
jgi:hypothetical protein